jgi:hypothetical protein
MWRTATGLRTSVVVAMTSAPMTATVAASACARLLVDARDCEVSESTDRLEELPQSNLLSTEPTTQNPIGRWSGSKPWPLTRRTALNERVVDEGGRHKRWARPERARQSEACDKAAADHSDGRAACGGAVVRNEPHHAHGRGQAERRSTGWRTPLRTCRREARSVARARVRPKERTCSERCSRPPTRSGTGGAREMTPAAAVDVKRQNGRVTCPTPTEWDAKGRVVRASALQSARTGTVRPPRRSSESCGGFRDPYSYLKGPLSLFCVHCEQLFALSLNTQIEGPFPFAGHLRACACACTTHPLDTASVACLVRWLCASEYRGRALRHRVRFRTCTTSHRSSSPELPRL